MKGEHLSHAIAPLQRATLVVVELLLGAISDTIPESRETSEVS